MAWTQKTCDYTQGRLWVYRLWRKDHTCQSELSSWFIGPATKKFLLNKMGKWSKNLSSLSQQLFWVPESVMDPVVATYMIPVRQWAAASEKLNFVAHHIPFNIQGLHPQPERSFINWRLCQTSRPLPEVWTKQRVSCIYMVIGKGVRVFLTLGIISTPLLLHPGEWHLCWMPRRNPMRRSSRGSRVSVLRGWGLTGTKKFNCVLHHSSFNPGAWIIIFEELT